MEQHVLVKTRNIIDGVLKFPNLRKGDIGVQVGFDFSSPNLTSDLLVMCRRVEPTGKIIGIDPDPFNHEQAVKVIEKHHLPIELVQKATFHEQTSEKLILTKRASWNRLTPYAEPHHTKGSRVIEVELDTVDHILASRNIPIDRIRHINITNNGAEYNTLRGMHNLLETTNNLAITAIGNRPGVTAIVNGKRDYQAVVDLLLSYGFETRFYRMSQLIWWGLIHQLILKGRSPLGEHKLGVVIAHKGHAKSPWYQSFS